MYQKRNCLPCKMNCHGSCLYAYQLLTEINMLCLFLRCWNQLYLACLKDVMYQEKRRTLSESTVPRYMRNFGDSCRWFWRKCWQVQTSLSLSPSLPTKSSLQLVWRCWEAEGALKNVSAVHRHEWICTLRTHCGPHNQKFDSTVTWFWIFCILRRKSIRLFR